MSQTSSVDGLHYEQKLVEVLQTMGLCPKRRFYVFPDSSPTGNWVVVNDSDAAVMEMCWCRLVEARIERQQHVVKEIAREVSTRGFRAWGRQLQDWQGGALPLCNKAGQRCTEIDLEVYIPSQQTFPEVPTVG
eukprot:6065891-Amphidinium_carterae.1